jgi:uncharacterized protein (UPF0276 family)
VEVVVGAEAVGVDAEAAVVNSEITNIPNLGVGIGYREPFHSQLFLNRQNVDFLEITADHFFDATSYKEKELDLLADHFTLIPHGLNLSLGSAEGLNENYVKKFVQLVKRVKPPYWSEHIAFTSSGGVEIGHLTPLPFTHEAIDALCRNVERMRQYLDIPIVLENITYTVDFPGAQMSEAQFLTEILRRTGCGLLLDITNLHVNSVNHHYDVKEFLRNIPIERIVQLHFVGVEMKDGVMIDSHSQPTPPEIWELMDYVLSIAPVKGVILERDENIPDFNELSLELQKARSIGRGHKRWL